MSAPLAQFLRAKLKELKWSYAQVATRAGIPKSTISNIINNPDRTPDLDTLDGLARVLDVPLATLITLAGFHIDDTDASPKDEQIAILLAEVPDLREVMADLVELTPEDLRAIRAYLAGARWKTNAR